MVVQDLIDETDVFMEFGHLSAATRKKIEEFRRRRKEAEEYNENSPIKPPKARRTSKDGGEPSLTSKEKSLRQPPSEPLKSPTKPSAANAFQDPLERLKQLENRLQSTSAAKPSEQGAVAGEGEVKGPEKKRDHRLDANKLRDKRKIDTEIEKGPAFVSPTVPAEQAAPEPPKAEVSGEGRGFKM